MLRPARLALLPCLLLLAACGLEKIPYLNPPVGWGPSGTTFSFTRTVGPTGNSESGVNYQFEGFELYYKFYTTADTVDTGIADRSGLLAASFHRVCGGDVIPWDLLNTTKPLIEVAWNDPLPIDFTLDFGASPEPQATDDRDPHEITALMRRWPQYSSTHSPPDQFKRFAYVPSDPESYRLSDQDVGDTIWGEIEAGRNVLLALYVLSYGTQDYGTDLYSDAVYLGSIEINFGW
jgi:hypothetical protein